MEWPPAVTGFGLLGHALEIARGSNMTMRIDPFVRQSMKVEIDYCGQ